MLIFYVTGAVISIVLLAFTAFPDKFFDATSDRKKRLGLSSWGLYNGQTAQEADELGAVEITVKRKKMHGTYGSSRYAKGTVVS